MKRTSVILPAVAAISAINIICFTPGRAGGEEASPVFGVTIPDGYRQWELVAVAHEEGLDELRGILGNGIAMQAYREGTLPFPDGAVLAKLAWKHVPSSEFNGAFVQAPRRRFR